MKQWCRVRLACPLKRTHPSCGRVESYSCKMVGPEKTLYKKLNFEQGHNPRDLQALSPPDSRYAVSPSNSLGLRYGLASCVLETITCNKSFPYVLCILADRTTWCQSHMTKCVVLEYSVLVFLSDSIWLIYGLVTVSIRTTRRNPWSAT